MSELDALKLALASGAIPAGSTKDGPVVDANPGCSGK
jgi:hypothetical protein